MRRGRTEPLFFWEYTMNASYENSDSVTHFWDALLSREPERIRRVFQPLDQAARKSVIGHLRRMATEEGWHPEQRLSALAAIDAVRDLL